jgi:hypothetical protein
VACRTERRAAEPWRRSARALVAGLLACGLWAPEAPAQPVLAALRTGVSAEAEDPANDLRWQLDRCLLGLGYHSVMKVTAAAAGGARRAFERRSVCVYGAAHVGLGGTRASVGSAVTIGRFASAVGVSGGLLRTFGRPGGDAVPWRTWVGGSVHLWPLLGVHTEVGAWSLLTRPGESGQRLVTWGVGFGY